jgi:c-di-AMP phosphodiesterase-like protein
VGLNASTYIQNYEYSRIAIEMALGRGGDQVVIKNGNNINGFSFLFGIQLIGLINIGSMIVSI